MIGRLFLLRAMMLVTAGAVVHSAAATPDSLLPSAPEKTLVLQHCMVCHDLAWVSRSGGDVAGWMDRLKRMRRSGATLPPDKFAAVAAYLARALPERPVPAKPDDTP